MTLEISYDTKEILYNHYLNIIGGIKFTSREIDIISSIMHNRGEKKIAQLLSISPRTVSAHVHNVMLKLGCNSKEYIMNYIEKSGKIIYIKQYYLLILIAKIFSRQLIKISRTIYTQEVAWSLYYKDITTAERKILKQIKSDLKIANINLEVTTSYDKKEPCNFYVLNSTDRGNIKGNLLILKDNINKEESIIESKKKYLNFSKKHDYYFLIFELIAKIKKNETLIQITQEFESEYRAIEISWQDKNNVPSLNSIVNTNKKEVLPRYYVLYTSVFILCGILVWFSIEKLLPKSIESEKIISDLPLPNEKLLLKRSHILAQIHKKLNDQEDSIKKIALVGPGGGGKTTIARQYARKLKIQLIWEVNAETADNLILSFEQLAYSLCKKEEERQELITISQVKDHLEKEKKLLIFLTKKIKNYSWLIVYNNVETFQNIQKYFPYDPKVWGSGKVIITTRDSNIANNNYILSENVITINELTIEDKLELFDKVMSEGKIYSKEQKLSNAEFLEKIPPYPLDISLAAYYLKEEHISYDKYLEHILDSKENFISIQEIILNDIGEYKKTRYDIVKLSVERIIEIDSSYANLLLFISLIDSEKIPKSLLTAYGGEVAASKFIHELKKFSLIVENTSGENKANLLFSIHRNTQKIILSFLQNSLKLDGNAKQFQDFANILGQYIDDKLNSENSIYIAHSESFLNHKHLFDRRIIYELMFKLSEYYSRSSNYTTAKNYLNQVFEFYQEFYGKNHIKTAEVLKRLGIIYRNTGEYNKSMEALEKAYVVYRKNYGDEDIKTMCVAVRLGSLCRNTGNYVRAKVLLEKAVEVFHKHYGSKNIQVAWATSYLAGVYKNLGDYDKAKNMLENARKIYIDHYGSTHSQTAWISARLGIVYNAMGEYEKAKVLFEESLAIYRNHFGENCIETAWCLSHLGNIYNNLGDYEKAKNLVQQSLNIYGDYFNKDHPTFSWALMNLGNVYQNLGEYTKSQKLFQSVLENYEKIYNLDHIQTAIARNYLGKAYMNSDLGLAEDMMLKAFNIFKKNNHIEMCSSLENLAELYQKKSDLKLRENKVEEAGQYKDKSIKYMEQARKILKDRSSENSS